MRVFQFYYFRMFIFFKLCLIITPIFANSEESDNEKRSLVTLGNSEKYFSQERSKNEICSFLNFKLVTFVDLIYYVKDCKLMLIKDAEVSNQLIQDQHKKIISLPTQIYSLLDIGKNYTLEDYSRDFGAVNEELFSVVCAKYEKEILTSDNIKFYLIQGCKKRLFRKYSDIQHFISKSKPIYSVDDKLLSRFPVGPIIVVDKKSDEIVVKISEERIKSELPSIKVLCAKLEKKVVAFHEGFFFVENCNLYTISDFSLDVQKKADELGGIKELTVQQAIGLPQVGAIKSIEVLKKLR